MSSNTFSKNMPQKLITEFLGTMFLTMTVKLAAASSVFAPFAIGTVLMIWVYMGGCISGGQYNPAVALGVFIRYARKNGEAFRVGDFVSYVFTQCAGGICGGLCSLLVSEGDAGLVFPNVQDTRHYRAFFGELFYTSLLVYTVLSVATSTNRSMINNHFFGACIGFSVVIGAISIGSVSGASLNPAVWLGCVVSAMVRASQLGDEIHPHGAWLYWVAPTVAGLMSGALYRFIDLANVESKETKQDAQPDVAKAPSEESSDSEPLKKTTGMAQVELV